eukprot:g963.t1
MKAFLTLLFTLLVCSAAARAGSEKIVEVIGGRAASMVAVVQNREWIYLVGQRSVLGAQALEIERRAQPTFAGFAVMQCVRFARPKARRALQLGLGAGTVPTYLRRHGIPTDVVEINWHVIIAARKYFEFDACDSVTSDSIGDNHDFTCSRGRSFHRDALSFIERGTPDQALVHRYDIVLVDVYSGRNPAQFYTAAFFSRLRDVWLAKGGLLCVNFVGFSAGPHAAVAARIAHTMRATFARVRVFRDKPLDRQPNEPTNLLYFASNDRIHFDLPVELRDAQLTRLAPIGLRAKQGFQQWEVFQANSAGATSPEPESEIQRQELAAADATAACMWAHAQEMVPEAVWHALENAEAPRGRFALRLSPLPRHPWGSERVERLLRQPRPVPFVITNTSLVTGLQVPLSNLSYLALHVDENLPLNRWKVLRSSRERFLYVSLADKESAWFNPGRYELPAQQFDAVEQMEITFGAFVHLLREYHEDRAKFIYLQDRLARGEDQLHPVGPAFERDLRRGVQWKWLRDMSDRFGFFPDGLHNQRDTLWVGSAGVVTPLHYDMDDNLFAHVVGAKRVVVLPPEEETRLYPFPVSHPADRQAQVDIANPDFARFPEFAGATGETAVLEPGDVLYIPAHWWHQFETENEGAHNGRGEILHDVPSYSASISFWGGARPSTDAGTAQLNLKGDLELNVMNSIGGLEAARFFRRLSVARNATQWKRPSFFSKHPRDVELLERIVAKVRNQLGCSATAARKFLYETVAGRFPPEQKALRERHGSADVGQSDEL